MKSGCNSGKIYPFYPAIRIVSCGVRGGCTIWAEGTTLERVGEIAGVSKGVVLHHFKDKSALLEAVFSPVKFCFKYVTIELFHYTETPYERLWAIASNFSFPIYTREVCQAWVSLLSEVPHSKNCQRVQSINNAKLRVICRTN